MISAAKTFAAGLLFSLPISAPILAQVKSPVPDAKAEAKAQALLLDIFGRDLKKAATGDAKAQLAAELLQQGKESRDDAAVRFVCYKEAAALAAAVPDASLALAVVDEMHRAFEIDVMLRKADVVGLVVAATKDKDQGLALVDVIRPLLNEAIELDHYKAAHQLADAAVNAARKAQKVSLVLELQKRAVEVTTIEKSFAKVQGYLDRVAKDPQDAVSHHELGKYFAFQKKRWEKALPYFARSAHKDIALLARRDLQNPKDAKEQAALADGWWELAKAEKEGVLAIQMRAMYWYDKSLPALSGINRTKAQKRIDVVQDQLAGTPSAVVATYPVGEIRSYKGHNEEVRSVAFSYDGRYVASASRDKSVLVYDLQAKEAKEAHAYRGHSQQVWAVAFHPNNRYVLSGSWDATVRMWDFKTGNEVKRWTHAKDVNGLVLSRDGNTLLTASDDKHAYLWNANTGDEIRRFPGHFEFVYATAFSPDGRYIATGGVDKTVRVFDLATAQLVKAFEPCQDTIYNIAFLPDSRHVLSSGDSVIRVFDVQTGKEARRFEGLAGRAQAMALSPDGRRLLTGDDNTVKLWDVATGKMTQSWGGHSGRISCVAFSHDGRRGVSGGEDGTVRIWGLPPR
jgi:hypothetical protein